MCTKLLSQSRNWQNGYTPTIQLSMIHDAHSRFKKYNERLKWKVTLQVNSNQKGFGVAIPMKSNRFGVKKKNCSRRQRTTIEKQK